VPYELRAEELRAASLRITGRAPALALGSPTQEPDLALTHQGERGELGDLPERRGHRLEHEEFLPGPKPAHVRLVFAEERGAGEAILGPALLERRAGACASRG